MVIRKIWDKFTKFFEIFEISSEARFRSSHQMCSMKKVVLRNFTKFTRKHLCQSLLFVKAAGLMT